MKGNFRILLAAVSMAASITACVENEMEQADNGYYFNDDPDAVTFVAQTQTDVPTDTRTALGETEDKLKAVNWVAGDAISVFDADNANVQFTTGADKTTSGTFAEVTTGTFKKAESGVTYYAVYPYAESNAINTDGGTVELTVTVPDDQVVSHGTFAANANAAVAKTDGAGNLAFQNVCGYLRFYISKGSRTTAVKISGNKDEIIAGTVKVKWEEGVPVVSEVVDGKTSITFHLEDNGTFPTGKEYYVALLPKALEGGIKIEMTTVEDVVTVTGITENGTQLPRTMNPVKRASAKMTIKRNTILRLPHWDRLEWRSAMLLDVEASYFDKQKDDGTGGTLNTAEKKSDGNYYSKVNDIYSKVGAESSLYKTVDNPHKSGINTSNKVLKVDATGKSYTTNTNARLSVYTRKPFYSEVGGNAAIITKFNAVRLKVYYGNEEELNKTYFPRVQMGPNNWKDSDGNTQARPIFSPTYVNGVKMSDVYIVSTGSNGTEDLKNYIYDYNQVTESWVKQFHSAIKFDEWNDLVFVIGDEGASKNLIAGTDYLRIHPFFPADPNKTAKYHADTYGVMYIDDIELIDF